MSVGDLINREERPPYVRFERRPIEDKQASIAQGRYVAKDVDFALVTPTYSKDCVEYKIERWLENAEKNVRDGRIPPAWLEKWKEALRMWKNGQEMPLNGTAIRGWGLISPAQQETLIRMNCLTVEDLAVINDEGMRRIGMGALELKNKAMNWLQTMDSHGPIASQMTALQTENKNLKVELEGLKEKFNTLIKMVPARQPDIVQSMPDEITASDLLEDEPPSLTPAQQYEAKFGKPVHHRMKEETILAALKE